MEGIIIVIVILWFSCALLSLIFDADKDVDWTVIALFPANLIYVLKVFWKSIIKAIKS